MNRITELISRESPLIMSVFGIGLFTGAVISAVRTSNEAEEVINKLELPEDTGKRLLVKAKSLLPVYGPALGMYFMGTAMVLGSYQVQKSRYIAMGTLYLASRQSLEQWKNVVQQEIGPKKFDKVEHVVDEEIVKSRGIPPELRGLKDGKLFYCKYSDRYFVADSVALVRKAITLANSDMFNDGYTSLNSMYYHIGVRRIPYGDLVGWRLDNGPIEGDIRAVIDEDDDTTVYTLGFTLEPKHNFERFM